MTFQTTLPSGTRIAVRSYTVRELDAVISQRRQNEVITSLLGTCVVEHQVPDESPNIYPDERIDWARAPVGDRVVAKLALRAATHPGIPYEPRVTCPVRGCRSACDASYSIEEILASHVVPFPRETLVALAAGQNRFEHRIGDVIVASRIMDGALAAQNEKRRPKTKKGEDSITIGLASRIVDITTGGTTIKLKSEIEKWVGDCAFGTVNALLEAMDAVDGGLETAAQVECPECGWSDTIDLPFSGGEFWTPSVGKKKTSWASRAAQASGSSEE